MKLRLIDRMNVPLSNLRSKLVVVFPRLVIIRGQVSTRCVWKTDINARHERFAPIVRMTRRRLPRVFHRSIKLRRRWGSQRSR